MSALLPSDDSDAVELLQPHSSRSDGSSAALPPALPPSNSFFLSSPTFAYVALVVAVLSMSSGGIWFALMSGTPPIMKACWRMTATSLMQLPAFLLQLHRSPPPTRARFLRSTTRLFLSGACLGLHFATWSWSIDNTSLTHALLLCSATPVVIIVWAVTRCAINRVLSSLQLPNPLSPSPLRLHFLPPSPPPLPSPLEAIGCSLGFTGICLLLTVSVDTTPSTSAPSAAGDLSAFAAAVLFWFYAEFGQELRRGDDALPLFMYAYPVTSFSAVVCAAASWALEGSTDVFGWLMTPRLLAITVCASFISGILGHTAANFTLKIISPLVLSVACLWEPLIGSLYGWAAGLESQPSNATIGSGILLMFGCLCVTLGGQPRFGSCVGTWKMKAGNFFQIGHGNGGR